MKLSPHTTRFEGAVPPGDGAWTEADPLPPPRARRVSFLRKPFFWLVLVPTLLVGIYLQGIAADQYVSEARFVVRSRSDTGTSSLGSALAQAGIGGGGGSAGQPSADAQSVREFMTSHDAARRMAERLPLEDIYRRPEADPWARMWFTDPERMTRYLGNMITVSYENSAGVMALRVRSFRPEDSHNVAQTLLLLGEELANRLSERAREDTLRIAREEVAIAERRVIAAREALNAFREREQNLDATIQARAAADRMAQMETSLAQARTELRERSAYMRPDNPALLSISNRIAAIERQMADERSRQTTGRDAITPQLAEYERLMMEREFADRQMSSATQSLEMARVEASRQQMYVARVVEPNLPVYPLYPRKIITILSTFAVLCVAFCIGWLIVAGMREHAA